MQLRKLIWSTHVLNTETGKWEIIEQGEALFHQWGVRYEEFENGAGNESIAIIELPDGTVREVAPSYIRFLEPLPPAPHQVITPATDQ